MSKRARTRKSGFFTLKFISAIAFSCLLIGAAHALDPAKSVTDYVHTNWQTDDGLPQNYVQSIAQTRDGYLWLATQEGLVRFDGTRFTVFDNRNTPQIRENNIQALFEDREGSLWIGTENGGLARLRDGRFESYTAEDGLASNIIDAVYEDRKGDLWIGTLAGLNRFADGKFITYTTRDGLASDTVLAICEDRHGNLWIGTEGGLNKFTDGKFTTYTTRDGLADNLVRAVIEDRERNLWIATRNGLSRLANEKFTTYTTRDGLASNSAISLLEDRQGNLWIGTSGGLNRFARGKLSAFTAQNGLTNNKIASLCEDREGNLWIGTYGGGLSRLKDGRFIAFTKDTGLSDETAQPILEDREGNVWIGTQNGLNKLSDGKTTIYTARDGLADDRILSLCQDSRGGLWVGTSGGLSCLRNKRFTSFTTKDGLSDNEVLSIIESRSGKLWIGTAAGLNLFDGKKFTVMTTREGLSNDSVWALLEDREGNLWAGTDGGGLNQLRDGKIIVHATRKEISNDIVMSLYEDAQGVLWIGTSGGLNRLKDGIMIYFTTADGLFDDVIFQILEDGRDNLWMSCNKGVFRVSKRELEDFAESRARGITKTITSISYGTADGMKSRECNGGFQPAGWKSRDGSLWFPTIKGAVRIEPDRISLNDIPPPVVIEEVFIDGRSIEIESSLRLDAGSEKFEFHYTGLSFIAPEKVRFRYKLEGYDRQWIDAGARREAVYNNLAPGSYTFRVMACNNDGVWNEAGASMGFYLKPRFYQTWWFYLACALAAGLAVWGLYWLRVSQMREKFALVLSERSRIAREIHDTLAQGFVGIALQLEAVKSKLAESPEAARQHIDLASNMVAHSLSEARRTVWNLRSQSLEDGTLASALAAIAKQLTEGTQIEACINVTGAERRLASHIESNLLRIGQEAITNTVRHSRAGKIDIGLRYEDRNVTLWVRDDGCGFDVENFPAASQGHFGVMGMRERAEQLDGELTIRSSDGGTEVMVVVPVDG